MNTMTLLVYVNYLMIAIEVFAVTYLADGFFRRKSSSLAHILSFIILAVLAIIDSYFFEALILPRISLTILLYCFWILYNFKTSVIKSLIASCLLVSFQWIIDEAFLAVAIYVDTHSSLSLFDDPFAYYTLMYAAKLTELFIAVLVRQWARKKFQKQSARWSDWLRVSIIPFAVVIIAAYTFTMLYGNPQLASSIFGCTLMLIVLDVMSIILLRHMERQQQAVIDNVILQQNIKLETEHIQVMRDAYDGQRKQTHDFNNQLAVLKSMADRGAPQAEFSEYLEQILSIDFSPAFCVDTNRLVIDIVVSQRYAEAKAKNISFELDLSDLSAFPLPDAALVIVLTNLIDNAIEACEKIADPAQRRILLKMQVKPSSAFLYIENTTAVPVHIVNNRIYTTKSDPLIHGFGLKNICTMLDRHNGMYALNYSADGIFCFSAKIPIAQP